MYLGDELFVLLEWPAGEIDFCDEIFLEEGKGFAWSSVEDGGDGAKFEAKADGGCDALGECGHW